MRNKKRGFLSYAHEDRDTANRLFQSLNSQEIDVWYDQADFDPNQDVDSQILNALKESSFIIILLSKTSVAKKGYIRKEIRLALDMQQTLEPAHHFIIPVRIEECQPSREESGGLSHYIDLWPNWSDGITSIHQLIPQDGGKTDLANSSLHDIQTNLTNLEYLKETSVWLGGRRELTVFLENCVQRLLRLDDHVVSRKVINIEKYIDDFSACLELHYIHNCGELDPNTICHVCNSKGQIIHGVIDLGGYTPSDYNDNYISWCTNCFWSYYLFEIDYLGTGPLKFDYAKNIY